MVVRRPCSSTPARPPARTRTQAEIIRRKVKAMRRGVQRWIGLLVVCAFIPGCLLNSVHSISRASRTKPDRAHTIVVIGMALDVTWPYSEFQLTFPEYSVEKQSITGNCFHYNRIEATRPSMSAKVTYLAFEVPANVYVYLSLLDLVDTHRSPSPIGHAFIAPPGATVYFGDYVFVSNKSVEFRRDINAARASARELLPRDAVLELAQPTTAPGAHVPLCTP
jgi:hypothetical protein